MTDSIESTEEFAKLREQPFVSAAPPRGLFAGTAYSIKAIYEQKNLVSLLIRREIKARYKDSVLGFGWSLLRPLTQLLIYYVAIGKFLQAERSIPDFAIFVFTGLTAWGLFAEVLSTSTTSIVANAGLIKKVYLPREIFPLSSAGSALFNFFVQFVILIVASILIHTPTLSPDLLLLPLAFAVLVVFSIALGLLLAAVNVYLRDIQHLVEVLLLVLFWASPITYSYALVHNALQGNLLEQIFLGNPVTLAVMGFQKALWAAGATSEWPDALGLRLLVALGVSLLLLWFSQRVFARLEGNFAQEL